MKRVFYLIEQGKTYNKLTALEKLRTPHGTMWRCRCICGRETRVHNSHLAKGVVKSCGTSGCAVVGPRIDLTGQKFGKLTALKFVCHQGRAAWLVRCACGLERPVRAENLRKGNTRSCGRKGCVVHGSVRRVLADSLAAKRQTFRGYRNHASARELPFELTLSRFLKICSQPCHYCGLQPSNTTVNRYGYGDWTYNGIDRKNNDKGYVNYNVVACCRVCNRAKNAMSYKDFVAYLDRVAAFRQ